jgi:outer membrane protein OmpA-like peptidoglycan-associated protein
MMSKRLVSLFAMLAVLLPVSGAVLADVEGPHVTFSPHGGAAFWLNDIDLAEDILYGGRLGLMLGAHLGFEGTVDLTPTHHEDLSAPDFNRVTHYGGNFVLNVAPYRLINPYMTFGWTEFHFDREGGVESTFNGWEAGGGFKIRMAAGDGKRVDLRLDARNVFTELDPPFPQYQTVQNTLLVSAGLQFSMGGPAKDTDWDGVSDRRDHCPSTPRFALVDNKGCPSDTDEDGIFDGLDKCPATVAGSLVDNFGCALDNDGDGVADGIDQCPNTPTGALVNTTGCPLDGDADGVFDGLDDCPTTMAGVMVNARGCGVDTDGDGVLDGIDLCAATPAGVKVDAKGCPVPTSQKEVELLDTGLIRLDTVHFASGKADLKPSSFAALREVGDILVKWPQLRIEIGGHTDSQGAEAFNQSLSEHRAQSVFQYLMGQYPQIKSGQYIVRGYGESKSISTNDTAEGRSQNRRVEFRVLNRDVLRR